MKQIEELQKALQEIDKTAEAAIDEAHGMVGARMLMSVRWIRKVARRALGQDE